MLVLEREKVAGGCMRTEAITAPGYIHDVMATTFVLFITSPAFGKLAPDLDAGTASNSATSPNPTGVLLPDGRSLILSMDRAANAAEFNAVRRRRRRPAARGHRRSVERDAPLLFALLGGALWTRGIGDAARCRKRGGAARAASPPASARRSAPAAPGSRRATNRTSSAALFAPWVLHAGLGPENAFSGEIARVIAFALEAAGAPIVKGGAAKAVAAFEALIREQGGEVRTGADVAEVRRLRRTGERRAAGER